MADALNVEPAVMIAAAAKPIAILRIMMLLHLLGDAPQPFRVKPQRLRLSCSVRQYLSVSRLRNPNPNDGSRDVPSQRGLGSMLMNGIALREVLDHDSGSAACADSPPVNSAVTIAPGGVQR
jgi:hypothetical protein